MVGAMDEKQRSEGMALAAGRLGQMLAVAVADVVLGTLAPRCLAAVHSLRRAAMSSYLAGCALMMLGAMQVTADGLGLAIMFLPAAASTLTVAIGCHAKLRGKGTELIGPGA